MFGNIMEKMREAKIQMEEIKKKLATMVVVAYSENELISVSANGNKEITDVMIQPEYLEVADIEMLKEDILTTTNRALQMANELNEREMKSVAQGMMPGGLDFPL